jgi:predicted P-loop ATPase
MNTINNLKSEILGEDAADAGVGTGGKLEFNEMTGVITINRVEIQDDDVTRVRERIEQRFGNFKGEPIQLGKDMMWDAVLLVAKERSYHPVREYLDGLVWDKQPRLERVVTEILKAEGTLINELMIRKFAIACVARGKHPGEKVDNMLVLQGAQGIQSPRSSRPSPASSGSATPTSTSRTRSTS